MKKINNLGDLKALQTSLKQQKAADEKTKVIIRIAMATCSIASGAGPVLEAFREQMPRHPVEYLLLSTGCTGLCHAEPTVEVTRPNTPPVMFRKVDVAKVGEIINTFIIKGEPVEGALEGR